jgi:hypothetical protein
MSRSVLRIIESTHLPAVWQIRNRPMIESSRAPVPIAETEDLSEEVKPVSRQKKEETFGRSLLRGQETSGDPRRTRVVFDPLRIQRRYSSILSE